MKVIQFYSNYQNLRSSPLWRLLAADNAAIILSILQANLTKGEQRGAASLFFERVEQDLEGLRGLGARSSSNGSTLRSFLVKRGFFRKTF